MLTVNIDPETEKALTELTSDGRSATDVIREAIRRAAWRRHMELAELDAKRLASDPEDRAEAQAIMRDMEDLRAW
ncbi:hypothetical protein HKK74_26130 [Actinomadura alba]|uniref:Ribbon-helix-helix protein, CopG family n=2 Tax=Actinomadura alba TaxID=406431 RepID=A0ABR7LW11_9ACTN|nr:hypothetical protein [Actinomadura alba]